MKVNHAAGMERNLQAELGQLPVEMAEDGSSVREANQPMAAKPAECLKVRLRRQRARRRRTRRQEVPSDRQGSSFNFAEEDEKISSGPLAFFCSLEGYGPGDR